MSVVYLHGLGQTPAGWESVLRVLGQESGGLCPDLFGLIRGKEVCYENLYQAFSRYCGALPAPLTLCGLSLGGVLALQYGIEHSDRVGALVLIGTQFVMPKGLLRLQNAMFRLMPGSMFSASGLSKADTMRLSRSMMALDFRGGLARLRCPVLAVCGTGDHANQKAARQLCRLVPQGELALIPGAGHEVNTDAPEALAEVLVRFLRPLP
ncbi:alpha/beta hydrolase [Clostridium sp.]|uniref:alpha/beta fold hydrolase n=1 Tax=Clostridium sp. TaxID=1506 RepID=UPI00307BE832